MFRKIQKSNYGSIGETTPIDIQAGGDATGLAGSVLPSSTRTTLGGTTVENVTSNTSEVPIKKSSKRPFPGTGLRRAFGGMG